MPLQPAPFFGFRSMPGRSSLLDSFTVASIKSFEATLFPRFFYPEKRSWSPETFYSKRNRLFFSRTLLRQQSLPFSFSPYRVRIVHCPPFFPPLFPLLFVQPSFISGPDKVPLFSLRSPRPILGAHPAPQRRHGRRFPSFPLPYLHAVRPSLTNSLTPVRWFSFTNCHSGFRFFSPFYGPPLSVSSTP